MIDDSRRSSGGYDDFGLDDDMPGGRRGRGRGGATQRRRPPMGERVPTQRVCSFCVERSKFIDYKRPQGLAQYVASTGKIVSRRRTGTCARHQRRLVVAIKRARYLALLPYTSGHKTLYGREAAE